jgi:hypothetical protein
MPSLIPIYWLGARAFKDPVIISRALSGNLAHSKLGKVGVELVEKRTLNNFAFLPLFSKQIRSFEHFAFLGEMGKLVGWITSFKSKPFEVDVFWIRKPGDKSVCLK